MSERVILAFAGRRIDAVGADPARFTPAAVPHVDAALARLFDLHTIEAVVGSAACGADILVLEAARARGVRARIVLPFAATRFRETSVVDRGAPWGPRYDALIASAARTGDVVVIEGAGAPDDDAAYARATQRIVEEALRLGRELACSVRALAVWDERPRARGDATQDFVQQVARAQMPCDHISTRGDSG